MAKFAFSEQENKDRELYDAVSSGNIQRIEASLLSGANINARSRYSVECADIKNNLPLIIATQMNRPDLVQYLLKKGANIHACLVDNGISGLEYARSQKGKYEIRALLEKANAEQIAAATPEWSLLGTTKLVHAEFSPEQALKLTSIFNFESRQYLSMTENLATNVETPFPATSFNDLPPSLKESALEKFRELGGEIDEGFVMTGKPTAQKPRPERSNL